MKPIPRIGRRGTLLAAMFLLVVGPSAPATASDGAPTLSQSSGALQKIPTLNGHIFMTTTKLQDPFVRTTFRSNLGVGATNNYSASSLVIGDSTIATVSGDLFYANLGFQFQYAIKPWLAMQLHTEVIGRVGTGLKAVLIEGVRASATGQVGWLVRVIETDRFYLSGDLGVSNNSITSMDPLGFVNGVIEDGGVTEDNRLVTDTPTLQTTAGVRSAYGWSETVGLIGFLQASAGDSYNRDERSAIYGGAGLGVDLALQRWLHAPMSLVAGYAFRNYPDVGDATKELTHANVWQLGYRSPGGFLISLDLTNQWVTKRKHKETLHVVWPLLTMKYYF